AASLFDAGLRRRARLVDADHENADRVAAAAGARELEAERRALLPRPAGHRLVERIGRDRLHLHGLGLPAGVHAKVDLVTPFQFVDLAGEAPGHHAGHVFVADVSRIELEADAVYRGDPVPFLDTGLLRRAAHGH